ncbi:cell division control protein 48 homolog C-like isoform X2 [Salvia hispanica]|uniref:cell division control protein 48 homolog C-like isoform X2 n=1 Tax=Salvia hispanica TaxID=49212 RepID=UPI002009CFAE|nr:cell division control protein 48 homolog C-like isoform X2 [Salvia hispanica]
MASGHRETPISGEQLSMAGLSDRVAKCLLQCHDQTLRCLIESAPAGAKNLSDAQIVQLICSTFPLTFSPPNRNLLIERIAKITPLWCRRVSAVDEPAAKRLKFDESRNANRQIEVARGSASASHSDSNGQELDSARSNKDANGDNMAIIGDIVQGNKLGVSMREVKKNEVKWPMFRDIGGMYHILECLKEEVIAPMFQMKLLHHFGCKPTTSILLHGPPGCGKTMLARAIGNETRVPFYETSAVSLKSGVSGPNHVNCMGCLPECWCLSNAVYLEGLHCTAYVCKLCIQELFCRAYKNAPSIVFIDEIDALTSETESLLRCPVKQLMACMKEPVNDGSDSERFNIGRGGYVLTIGATNKIDALDLALRQRFDHEYLFNVPSEIEQHGILTVLIRNDEFEEGSDRGRVVKYTQGYVAGDLVELVNKARMIAFKDVFFPRACRLDFEDMYEAYGIPFSDEQIEEFKLPLECFMKANDMVRPRAEMEAFSPTPYKNWDDVGGLQLLKLELERRIVKLIKFPQLYESLGEIVVKNLPTSFFLYGPSGCGKTSIVEALAREAGANFMHIKVDDLLNLTWPEELVKNIFKRAKSQPPCVVLFDELDLLSVDNFTDEDLERNKNAWKSEIYWLIWTHFRDMRKESRVYVIATSSRLENLERISLIKEDFGRMLYAPLPTPDERGEILKILARNKPIDAEVDLMALGKDSACENFSGSDLFALVAEASKFAIDRPLLSCGGNMTITNEDFEAALDEVSPSLSAKERKKWALHAKNIDVTHGASALDW